MKKWQDLLDSFSTKGGNIVLMCVLLLALMTFMLHVSHDQSDSALVSAVHDMMVGFGAALLAVLSGSSSRQQMADRIESALPKTTVNTGTVETVNVAQTTPTVPEVK